MSQQPRDIADERVRRGRAGMGKGRSGGDVSGNLDPEMGQL